MLKISCIEQEILLLLLLQEEILLLNEINKIEVKTQYKFVIVIVFNQTVASTDLLKNKKQRTI